MEAEAMQLIRNHAACGAHGMGLRCASSASRSCIKAKIDAS